MDKQRTPNQEAPTMTKASRVIGAVLNVDSHSNGITGAPFYVVRFKAGARLVGEGEAIGTIFIATVFEQAGHVAVLRVSGNTGISVGDQSFGENSWRGDVFEPELREIIQNHEATMALRHA